MAMALCSAASVLRVEMAPASETGWRQQCCHHFELHDQFVVMQNGAYREKRDASWTARGQPMDAFICRRRLSHLGNRSSIQPGSASA